MANYEVLSKTDHLKAHYLPRAGWRFAADSSVVPVLQSELGKLLPHFVLAFVAMQGEEPGYRLVALTGMGGGSLYVAPNAQWLAAYVPAMLRGFPFRLAHYENQQVLCVASGHLVDGNQGSPLFDNTGELAAGPAASLDFLQHCATDARLTAATVSRLAGAGVIEPWPLQMAVGKDGQPQAVEGLFRVNEQALLGMDAAALHDLRGAPLAMAYAQLFSMHQLDELVKRAGLLAKVAKPATPADLDELFGDNNDELSFGF